MGGVRWEVFGGRVGSWEVDSVLRPSNQCNFFFVLIGFLGRILIKTTKKRYYIGGSR